MEMNQPGPARRTVFARCVRFLQNMQSRFGQDSRESVTIHNVLSDFRRGRISKRETLKTIEDMIGDHFDLENDLMDVVSHEDATWAPGDFDLRLPPQLAQQQPTLPITPSPLQPIHQSTVRLPSLSTLFPPPPEEYPAFPQPTHADYHNHETMEDMEQWPPAGETSDYESIFDQPPDLNISPIIVDSQVDPAATSFTFNHTLGFSALPGDPSNQASHFHGPWAPPNDDHGYVEEQLHTSSHLDAYNAHPVPSWSHTSIQPHVAPQADSLKGGFMPLHSDTNMAPRPGQGNGIVPVPHPPPNQFVCKSQSITNPAFGSLDHHDARQTSVASFHGDAPHPRESWPQQLNYNTTPMHQPRDVARAPVELNETKSIEPEKPFIHGLCGKGFSSRAKVKKHHWGNKVGDLNTKTGCWAKHKKPHAFWDDHPSCQQEAPKPKHSAPPVRPNRESTVFPSVESKAPMVPAMIPKHESVVPDIPTLQNLPQLVASTLGPIRSPFMHSEDSNDVRHMQPRGSMDDLLKVVNAEVSMIEQPTPQGRHGSIVPNLDAHVVAAEIASRLNNGEAHLSDPGNAAEAELDHAYGPSSATGLEHHRGYIEAPALPESEHSAKGARV